MINISGSAMIAIKPKLMPAKKIVFCREEVRRGEPTVEEVKNEEQDERALPPHQ